MTETRVRRGAGWWPALVLWGTVIAVGSLYLASVEQHRRDARMEDRAAAAAVAALAPAAAPAGSNQNQAQNQAQAPVGAPSRLAEPVPVREHEPPGRSSGAPASAVVATTPAAAPQAHPVAAPKSQVVPVSPAEARAFAEAVIEVPTPSPALTPAASPTAAPVPGRAVGGAGGPGVAAGPTPRAQNPTLSAPSAPVPAGATEQARILAEYEALRRAAQPEAAPPWTGPMVPRGYGVPPSAPGPERSRQAPGYYPGYPGR
jgi:hypothetical protein